MFFRKKHIKTAVGRSLDAFIAYGTKKGTVNAGLIKGKAAPEVIDRGVYNNFGTDHVPERPFLNNAMRDNQFSYKVIVGKGMIKTLLRRGSTRDMLEELGEKMKDDIQKEILELSSPPNAPATVKKKGFNDPLLETYEMVESIDYEVET